MYAFISFLCICACLLSGYIGGYTTDKQMKAAGVPFKRVAISAFWKRIVIFSNLYPCDVLLIGFLMELSGLACSLAIITATLLAWILQVDLLAVAGFLFFAIHGIVLLFVSMYSYLKYVLYHFRTKHGCLISWKCEMLKLISQKPVICSVEVLCKPETTSNGFYQVRYGKWFPRTFYASCALGYHPSIGEVVYAIYRHDFPNFHLIPYCTTRKS